MIKLSAYDIETRRYAMHGTSCSNSANEGRGLIRSLLGVNGDTRVEGELLEVYLEQLSGTRHTQALPSLCQQLYSTRLKLFAPIVQRVNPSGDPYKRAESSAARNRLSTPPPCRTLPNRRLAEPEVARGTSSSLDIGSQRKRAVCRP